jgi:hypothetical protein
MRKKIPNSASSSIGSDAVTMPNKGGPRISPANNSPNTTGKPNLAKTLPMNQATVRIRIRFTIRCCVIITLRKNLLSLIH